MAVNSLTSRGIPLSAWHLQRLVSRGMLVTPRHGYILSRFFAAARHWRPSVLGARMGSSMPSGEAQGQGEDPGAPDAQPSQGDVPPQEEHAGAKEEKEETSESKRKVFTPRELYQASVESNAAVDKVKTAASASLALSGFGVLAWHHWATFATFNCLGGGLVLLGAALAPRTAGRRALSGNKNGEGYLKLKLLNNSERWKVDQKALNELLGIQAAPSELLKAQKAEEKEEGKQLKEALEQRNKEISEAVKAGETVSSIQARLRPRTFVFDFQPPMTGMARPDGMKKELEDLREIISFILHSANSPHDQAVVRIASPGV